jgi:hypothetical protein
VWVLIGGHAVCIGDDHFVPLFSILILATIVNVVKCVMLEVSCVIFFSSLDISVSHWSGHRPVCTAGRIPVILLTVVTV